MTTSPNKMSEEIRKQLVKSLSIAQVESVDDNGEAVIEYEADRLMQLITADRKRVALEARLQEVEVSIIELERSDDPRFYSKDEAIRSQRARYTQLKEEVEEI